MTSRKLKKVEAGTLASSTNNKKEISNLIKSYESLLKLADVISQSLLIKNNNWLIQVKAIRQHYLFENEQALTELKTMGKAAIEISKRSEGRNSNLTQLFSIIASPEESVYIMKNEQRETKNHEISMDNPAYISQIMQYLQK
ncbi:MAG: hypothetical protein HQL32_17160 [Planctomycetes bacterium]|nr:hypothetical protein [Planctomycetota bacterium]